MDNPQESHSRSDAFNDYRKAALAEPSRVDRKLNLNPFFYQNKSWQ